MNEDKARELAKRFGVRMCDENGDTHDEELYCLGLDDIIEMAKALAQPEQEPYGYVRADGQGIFIYGEHQFQNTQGAELIPVYTTPPQRKPLTDEEFLELLLRKGTSEVVGYCTFVGGSTQMQGRVGLLRSAKIIKEFVEDIYGIKEKNT